jgi:hypothetical protein
MIMPAPQPQRIRVVIHNHYSESDLVFVGDAEAVPAQILEAFAWLRLPGPTLLALEQLVEIIDREQCFSAEIDALPGSSQ